MGDAPTTSSAALLYHPRSLALLGLMHATMALTYHYAIAGSRVVVNVQ
jgi:hypothetical protein